MSLCYTAKFSDEAGWGEFYGAFTEVYEPFNLSEESVLP